jgi:PTS system nitrogen regulatory IIA component
VPLELSRLFRPETICLDLKGRDKEAVIGDLIDLLVTAGDLTDRSAAFEAVLERERKMSTGMQSGIAIPHGKTDSVRDIVAALGIHRRGVEFQSLDGRPAHLVVITVSPQELSGSHVQFLSEVGRILASSGTRERLLKARSAEEVVDLLTQGSRP